MKKSFIDALPVIYVIFSTFLLGFVLSTWADNSEFYCSVLNSISYVERCNVFGVLQVFGYYGVSLLCFIIIYGILVFYYRKK